MPHRIRVMIVDDSAVVRALFDRTLRLDASLEVVAVAANGQTAIETLKATPADVIILDVEMPVMDGMAALPELLRISPRTRIIIASTMTVRTPEISVRALQLGASDYLSKPSANNQAESEEFFRNLIVKIKALSPKPAILNKALPAAAMAPIAAPEVPVRQNPTPPRAEALALIASTGGPQALLELFKEFQGVVPRTPIFITQHMPPNFTTILAGHISKTAGIDCHEAIDDEEVRAGIIYLAPGDFHMTVQRVGRTVRLKLDKNPPENFCRPSADPMLRSLARVYGDGLLAAVLTGLGSDGARGASEVVVAGGTVVAQDEATSVIFGMPRAVIDAKLTSAVLPLDRIASYLIRAVT